MLSKRQFFTFLSLLTFLLPLAFLISWPSQRLQLIACNVGQGDALLVTKGLTQILIDGGPNNQVLDCLADNLPFWDKTIELMINTHPDKDHLAGLVSVLKSYQVKQIFKNSSLAETALFKEFEQEIASREIPVYLPQQGDKIKIAGMVLTVLWPPQRVLGATTAKKKTNENSIVFHFQNGDFDALFTGDITAKEEKEIIKDYQFQEIEVLKVAHHGSKYSSCQEFLQAVRPQIAVISVGKNSWGHPTKEVLERLEAIGAEILRTDQQKIRLKI